MWRVPIGARALPRHETPPHRVDITVSVERRSTPVSDFFARKATSSSRIPATGIGSAARSRTDRAAWQGGRRRRCENSTLMEQHGEICPTARFVCLAQQPRFIHRQRSLDQLDPLEGVYLGEREPGGGIGRSVHLMGEFAADNAGAIDDADGV